MKKLSCGILLFDITNQFLQCHPTYKKNVFDIPKGEKEPTDKMDVDAAIRELKEETGIILTSREVNEIYDLGVFEYMDTKDLHLFYLKLDYPINVNSLTCTSTFEIYGRMVPEIDGYKLSSSTSTLYPTLSKIVDEALKNIPVQESVCASAFAASTPEHVLKVIEPFKDFENESN